MSEVSSAAKSAAPSIPDYYQKANETRPNMTPADARCAASTPSADAGEASGVADSADSADRGPEVRPVVNLYTDGACSGNPGPGGWAYILVHPASGTERELSGGEPKTTNNRMELLAVIEGLNAVKRPSVVHLYSDSQYIVKGLGEWLDGWKAQGWRRGRKREPVMNIDLWQRLDKLRQGHDLQLNWVRSHDGHSFNERCDKLAVQAIARFK